MIKISLELPEFEKELSISVTLKKDGEVITSSSSSLVGVKAEISGENSVWKQTPEVNTITQRSSKNIGGNMMDISI